jgi:hypothetical protein
VDFGVFCAENKENNMKNQTEKVKIGIIFTLDFEIHGNGSGEFENWAYFPTAQMLNTFDTYGAKLTIMAEMGHYWAMKRYKDLFKGDIFLFESQLKNAIERGHDVQFHFHPQWIDAKFEGGNWHLDFSRKTIERLCYNYDEAYFYLNKGKEELQNLLTPINPDYQCVCFRAGFLQMQPSENMIKALEDAGFLSDSSVSKGMKADDNLRLLDFSSAHSRFCPWKTSNSEICNIDPNGKIYEFPILSDSKRFFDKIKNKIIKIRKGKDISTVISGLMAVYGKGMMPISYTRSFSGKLKSILSENWSYIDFCQLDHKDLVNNIKSVISDCKKINNYNYVPVVLIGHSKDFFFVNNLSLFLKACQSIEGVEFTTYSEAVNKIRSENNIKSITIS